jgi:hypothetical protein
MNITSRNSCVRWLIDTKYYKSYSITTMALHSPTFSTSFFYHGATAPSGPRPPHYRGLTIPLRFTTLCRTPLDESSARRRDLYLTTHNRQTSMPQVGFEPAIPASELPHTNPLDRDYWDRLQRTVLISKCSRWTDSKLLHMNKIIVRSLHYKLCVLPAPCIRPMGCIQWGNSLNRRNLLSQ